MRAREIHNADGQEYGKENLSICPDPAPECRRGLGFLFDSGWHPLEITGGHKVFNEKILEERIPRHFAIQSQLIAVRG